MTDHGDWLACADHRRDEADRGRLRPQLVRAGDAAGQNEGVVVSRARVGDGVVDTKNVTFVQVVEGLRRAWLGSEQLGPAAGVTDGLPRLRQLDLFRALVGNQEGHPAAGQLVRHPDSPSAVNRGVRGAYRRG